MLERCRNPRAGRDRPGDKYQSYGGRGITVCTEWQGKNGFAQFLADMGERPEGMTLDRVDVEQGYSKENCRWATYSEQNKNQRKKKPEEPWL